MTISTRTFLYFCRQDHEPIFQIISGFKYISCAWLKKRIFFLILSQFLSIVTQSETRRRHNQSQNQG